MRSQWKVGWGAILFVIVNLWATTFVDAEDKTDSVSAAMDRFYAALNDLFQGQTEPMQQVWSHAEDVTYMGPTGGMQTGWEQVFANWRGQASKQLGGEVKAESIKIYESHDLAVVCCIEVGTNIVDSTSQQVSIRATNIFRKEQGTWKMVGHHTDLLPFLAP